MKRLLSSLSYQSLRDGALYRLTGIFIVAMAVFGIVIGIASDETPCAGRLIADAPSVLWLFQYMIIAIIVGTVSAGDFKDKDLYYIRCFVIFFHNTKSIKQACPINRTSL